MTIPGATRFSISFPSSLAAEPVTGRMFVIVTRSVERPYVVAPGPGALGGTERGIEPRLQAGTWKNRVPFFGTYQKSVPYFSPWVTSAPFFGVDVEDIAAGQSVVVDGTAAGFPPRSLRDIPAGDYYVQAVLNVYTRFERSDGHVIWAHLDQWEGQHWNQSPGNMVSAVKQVHLDPAEGYDVPLELIARLPEMTIPPDTEYVRRLRFESPLLSEFWGRPIHLGAVVLLPEGYEAHPDRRYPVIYNNDHFNLGAPFGFSPAPVQEAEEQLYMRALRGLENGHEFYQSWIGNGKH